MMSRPLCNQFLLSNCLNDLESIHLKASYQLGLFIEKETNPLYSRVQALAIPVLCAVGELIKLTADAKRLIQIAIRSISSFSFKTGNIRRIATHICEHLRNVAGITTGIFIGLYSPLTARKIFLTAKAEKSLKRKLTPDTAATLYSVAYAVSHFFKKHNIDYRICSGSLLGAVRHGGIVPWDDDIDLMIHPNCVKKCKKLFEDGTFKLETGIDVKKQPFSGNWECFHPNSPKGEGAFKDIGLPFIDIFKTKWDKDKEKISHGSRTMEAFFPNEYFSVQEWNEAKEYPFGPLQLTSIQDAKSYLTRHYGDDVFDFAYQGPHHDILGKAIHEPFSFFKNAYTAFWTYGLPQRTYLEDRSPVKYDVEKYEKLTHEIDARMQKANKA